MQDFAEIWAQWGSFAYLGAAMGPAPNGIAGAAIALGAVFLPGLLLVTGMLPFWDGLRRRAMAQAAIREIGGD